MLENAPVILQPLRDLMLQYSEEIQSESQVQEIAMQLAEDLLMQWLTKQPLKIDMDTQFLPDGMKDWLTVVGNQPRTPYNRLDSLLAWDMTWVGLTGWAAQPAVFDNPMPVGCFWRSRLGSKEKIMINDGVITSAVINERDPKLKKLMTTPLGLLEVKIPVPSGKLLITDWFRLNEFTKAVQYDQHYTEISINEPVGRQQSTQYMAERGVFSVHVGDMGSTVFKNNSDLDLLIGGNQDEDIEKNSNLNEQGYVCSDVWSTTIVDQQILEQILVDSGMSLKQAQKTIIDYCKEYDVLTVSVTPNTYYGYTSYNGDFLDYATRNDKNSEPLMKKGDICFWALSPTPLDLKLNQPISRVMEVQYTDVTGTIHHIGKLYINENYIQFKSALIDVNFASCYFSMNVNDSSVLDLSKNSKLATDFINACEQYGILMKDYLERLANPQPFISQEKIDQGFLNLKNCLDLNSEKLQNSDLSF